MRESLELLIRTAGWQLETFESARAFLSHPRGAAPCCLVFDVTVPGLNGLELQQQIGDRTHMPIIFITGYGDVQMTGRHEAGSGRVPQVDTRALKSSVVNSVKGLVENMPARNHDLIEESSECLSRSIPLLVVFQACGERSRLLAEDLGHLRVKCRERRLSQWAASAAFLASSVTSSAFHASER